MRKQTKIVAVLSAAALLALGASMTSFAAGWEKDEAGIWHYYDSDDDMVTGEWKKDGGKWFYLDDDGDMLTDHWVDDEYYVGSDGAMLVNQWYKGFGDDEDQDDPEDDGEHW
ncbi:MAG: glucan-binding protein, partial [Clostridium sp.]|nr:glucan-binding protein [Clostridium sp.]